MFPVGSPLDRLSNTHQWSRLSNTHQWSTAILPAFSSSTEHWDHSLVDIHIMIFFQLPREIAPVRLWAHENSETASTSIFTLWKSIKVQGASQQENTSMINSKENFVTFSIHRTLFFSSTCSAGSKWQYPFRSGWDVQPYCTNAYMIPYTTWSSSMKKLSACGTHHQVGNKVSS
jgi:hypothetical protein